eukprot:1435067-Alexandrium_andersonii.AAC.1
MLHKRGHFYVCGSARQVPEDIYAAMKQASSQSIPVRSEHALQLQVWRKRAHECRVIMLSFNYCQV